MNNMKQYEVEINEMNFVKAFLNKEICILIHFPKTFWDI